MPIGILLYTSIQYTPLMLIDQIRALTAITTNQMRTSTAQCAIQLALEPTISPTNLYNPNARCIDCCIMLWWSWSSRWWWWLYIYIVTCCCYCILYWLALKLALTFAPCTCCASFLSSGAIPLAQKVVDTSCNLCRWSFFSGHRRNDWISIWATCTVWWWYSIEISWSASLHSLMITTPQ